MHRETTGVTEFLVPFFLVNTGMQLDLAVFRDLSVVLLAVAVTLVTVATKARAALQSASREET